MIIPDINYLENDTETSSGIAPTVTFRAMLEDNRFGERIDGSEAVSQSVLLNLMTERYKYPIFDRDYGIELEDLVNTELDYIQAVLPDRIRECLLLDDRVVSIDSIDLKQVEKNVEVTIEYTDVYSRSRVISPMYNFDLK